MLAAGYHIVTCRQYTRPQHGSGPGHTLRITQCTVNVDHQPPGPPPDANPLLPRHD
jgi:hypothetical protein